jgi:hypothetical protein
LPLSSNGAVFSRSNRLRGDADGARESRGIPQIARSATPRWKEPGGSPRASCGLPRPTKRVTEMGTKKAGDPVLTAHGARNAKVEDIAKP